MSETMRKVSAVTNNRLSSRVHNKGLRGAEEQAGAGRCHPRSRETFAETLLLLRAASLGCYPQPVARPRLLCEWSVLCFGAPPPAPGPCTLCPGGTGQRQMRHGQRGNAGAQKGDVTILLPPRVTDRWDISVPSLKAGELCPVCLSIPTAERILRVCCDNGC